MSDTCLHPLSGSGTSQTTRLWQALLPSNLQIDPHDLDALMVYALRMSEHIRFWDYTESQGDIVNGNWSDFWNNDPLFFLAGIGAIDTDSLERQYNRLENNVLELLTFIPEDDCAVDPRPEAMRNLITLIYGTARQLADWGARASIHPVLESELTSMIRTGLREPLRNLVQYDLGTVGALNDYESVFIYDRQAPPFAQNWDFTYLEFTQLDPWPTHDEDNVLDGDVIVPLRALFKRFLRVLIRLRDRADFYLEAAKNGERSHQPHIALFVAFLHLFRHLQNQLNDLTGQHLDYYYGEILQLEKRGALPDRAHLVFQLAVGALRERLEAGTLFRAGKDEVGKDLFYALERDMTINQGEVAEIRTLYLQSKNLPPPVITSVHEENILDTDKTTDVPEKIDQIQPFYSLGKGEGNLAAEGFAIASAQFETTRSDRRITVGFKLKFDVAGFKNEMSEPVFRLFWSRILRIKPEDLKFQDFVIDATQWNDQFVWDSSEAFGKLFQVSLSTEKDWEIIPVNLVTVGGMLNYAVDFAGHEAIESRVNVPAAKSSTISILMLDDTLLVELDIVLNKKIPPTTVLKKASISNAVNLPVLRLSLNKEYPFDQREYQFLSAVFNNIKVEVIAVLTEATGVTDFSLVEGGTNTPLNSNQNIDVNRLVGRGLFIKSNEILHKGFDTPQIPLTEPRQFRIAANLASTHRDSPLAYLLYKEQSFGISNYDYISVRLKGKSEDDASINRISRVLQYVNDTVALEIFNSSISVAGAIQPTDNIKLPVSQLRDYSASTEHNYLWMDFTSPAREQETPVFADLEISYRSTQVIFQDKPVDLLPVIGDDVSNVGEPILNIRFDDDLDHFFYTAPAGNYWDYSSLHKTVEAPVDIIQLFSPIPSEKRDASFVNRKAAVKLAFSLFPTHQLYPNYRRPEPVTGSPDWANGNLFIGVKGIQPEQMLSLLFQVVEGTEEDFEHQTPDIEWSYLSKNTWKRFPPGTISFDSTRGDENSRRSLVQSGIVELQMPADATNTDTLMKPGFYWVRASAVESQMEKVLALPKMAAIYAQAARVVLHSAPVPIQHFDQPLPPKTISQLQLRRAAVRKLEQRYPGFGGRAPESALAWYTRISERLRHKRRAVTRWDYERLVLEKFPEVRTVKGINHTFYDHSSREESMAGHVSVALIPYLTNRQHQNPLQPQPRAGLLEQVSGYLRGCANHFVADLEKMEGSVHLHLLRPDYEPVLIALSVRFRAGLTDVETWKLRLDEDLARFLAPWAFDDTVAPAFDRVVRRMEVLYFVENLDYVDVVEDLLLGTAEVLMAGGHVTGRKVKFSTDGTAPFSLIAPTNARSLLTSFQRAEGDPSEAYVVEPFNFGNLVLNFDKPDSSFFQKGLLQVGEDSNGDPYVFIRPKTPFITNHLIHVL